MSFDFALIVDSIPKMLMGIGLTFQLLFLSAALGLALAIVLLLMRISGRWYLAAPTMVYIYIFRCESLSAVRFLP
jgi:polar amino acid transport system permease protein